MEEQVEQIDNCVESDEYEEELVCEDVDRLNIGIGLLVIAPVIYCIAHYIMYEYLDAWLFEYVAYFFVLCGIVFVIVGIIEKIYNILF